MENRRIISFNGKNLLIDKYNMIAIVFSVLALLKCWTFIRQSGSELSVLVCNIVIAICYIILLCFSKTILTSLNKENYIYAVICLIYLLVEIFYTIDKTPNWKNAGITVVLITALYSLFDKNLKSRVFIYFRYLLVISSACGIIAYFIYLVGIPFPYTVVRYYAIETQSQANYINYFNIVLYRGSTGVLRLCGPFNEPGLLGTFCALFIASDNMRITKIGNLIIFIAGALSFSLAFWVLISIYYVLINVNNWKLLLSVFIFAFLYFIISEMQIDNETWNYFINRIFHNIDNSRTTKKFDLLFSNFLKSNRKWFGLGVGLQVVGVQSIKMSVYSYGIIGTFFYILFFFYAGVKQTRKHLPYIIVFLLSMIQRPRLFSPGYFILLFGGLLNLCKFDEESEA